MRQGLIITPNDARRLLKIRDQLIELATQLETEHKRPRRRKRQAKAVVETKVVKSGRRGMIQPLLAQSAPPNSKPGRKLADVPE